ncbi:hypothetical protein B0H14DRAFT_2628132 [Mycena olivaceomarginata]|nr:hypothetical protein B0H14DRAFT_2628132 [Mycena olivaceomarginata]
MCVFGGVKEMTVLHLTLVPPKHREGQGQQQLVSMALIDYAGEVVDLDEGDTQSKAAMKALWEYQNFLRELFNLPSDDPSRVMSDVSSSAGNANSIHNLIFSVSSVGMEALDTMREYLSELNARFEVLPERVRPVWGAPTPTAIQLSKQGSVAESTSPTATSSTDSGSMMQRPCKSYSRGSRGHNPMSTVLAPHLCCGWPCSSCAVHARSSRSTCSGPSATTLTLTPHMGCRCRALDAPHAAGALELAPTKISAVIWGGQNMSDWGNEALLQPVLWTNSVMSATDE